MALMVPNKNAMTQILTKEQLLPAKSISENNDKIVSEYEYEGENLVHELINLYITGEINYGLLQNKASEEGARMTAMDNATKNAGELVKKFTRQMNTARQAAITTEIMEIVSGAEALKDGGSTDLLVDRVGSTDAFQRRLQENSL